MRILVSMVSLGLFVHFSLFASSAKEPVFPIQIAENHSYLIDAEGNSFLYHADTPWMIFLKLTAEEAETYMTARKAQGFNTLQVQLTGFLGMKNRNGDLPFDENHDFSKPNEAYFTHVDQVIRKAQEINLFLAIAPLWAGCCGEGWAGNNKDESIKPMNKNGVEACQAFGNFLGERYGQYPHIAWILGGDNDPHESRAHYHALGMGLHEKAPAQLITYHAASSHSSTDVWEDAPWLNLVMVYTYFRGFNKAWNKNQPDVYEVSYKEYNKHPRRPFFLGESTYEGEHGAWGSALQARKQAYWCVLSGGAGHAYGSPNWNIPENWREILDLPGANSLIHLRTLFESRPWHLLVPDVKNQLAVEGRGVFAENNYATTAYASDGSFAITYIPTPRKITYDLTPLKGETIRAWWYNPRDGKTTQIGDFKRTEPNTFESPDEGDWVLVLDNANANFGIPGKENS